MAALVALVAAGGPRGTDLPAAAAGDEGRLSGVVWLDDNGDGVRGTSETGIESHELRLKSLRTGTETSARTRADGAYEFTALAPGPYELTIDPKPGVRTASRAGFLTAPAIRLIGPLTTGLTISGATSARVDFGIYAARNEPGFLGSV